MTLQLSGSLNIITHYKRWRNNWEDLTVFFEFPVEIRKIIYITNLIENLNWKIRNYPKNKLFFPTDDAEMKSVYLAEREATKRCSMSVRNWGVIIVQFLIFYGERLTQAHFIAYTLYETVP